MVVQSCEVAIRDADTRGVVPTRRELRSWVLPLLWQWPRCTSRVEPSNFHDYEMLRMNETPAIEVHIVNSCEAPGGMGEAETSAAAPALTNAILAATGNRIRKLPVANQARRTRSNAARVESIAS